MYKLFNFHLIILSYMYKLVNNLSIMTFCALSHQNDKETRCASVVLNLPHDTTSEVAAPGSTTGVASGSNQMPVACGSVGGSASHTSA